MTMNKRTSSRNPVAMLQLLLLLPGMTSVRACSFAPFTPQGPYIASPWSLPGIDQVLFTTLEDENRLLATLTVYNDDSSSSSSVLTKTPKEILVDVTTGSVTAVAAANGTADTEIPVSPLPETLADPSGGYTMLVQGSTTTFTKTNDGAAKLTVELEVPDQFEIDAETAVFFVSENTGKLYIFYTVLQDCSSGVLSDFCNNACPTCRDSRNRAAIVDPVTLDEVFQDFDYFDIYNGHGTNALTTVYDDIQVAQLGSTDSCGGTDYFYYTDNVVARTGSLQPGHLTALKYNGGQPKDLTAFTLYQRQVEHENGRGENERFVETFTIYEVNVFSGAIVSTVELDKAAIDAIAEIAAPVLSEESTSDCVCGVDAAYDSGTSRLTMNFDLCDEQPLESDWVGIYPCEANSFNATDEWWSEMIESPNYFGERDVTMDYYGFVAGQEYVSDQQTWWSYTCSSPTNGADQCQRSGETVWPSSGSVTVDPASSPRWAFWGGSNRNGVLDAGCYKVLLNREVSDDISTPPLPTVCNGQPWRDAFTFHVPSVTSS